MNNSIHIRNGMPARELGAEGWHKPWSGPNGGTCLGVMPLPDGRVALTQTADADSPALVYTHEEFRAFVAGVKAGEADFLL
ncbi:MULTISPECIES: DUF397 domain-containing protein [Streptomyces]|uniref:DUF397 domain-containing protein n=1 Tax=Streptomyces TaxID=1883 RepID=UPI0004CDCC30|nr:MULTISPECIES: DUF397 domain-containing protein [Streptomyces]KOT52689.1 AbaA-like protein [Streptomyces rimosus subsp. rimosus]